MIISARRLLARLRDVMAGTDALQARLDKIVRLIAAETVAEVCSCYVVRPGDVLELFATHGLNPGAVHRTRLRMGEGLVGQIAATGRPTAISNAPEHPNFAYRPETGEDPYHSLMGVPILRGGQVRGVLVVQNQHRRIYHEEEIETLQTIAMVVAELVAGGVPAEPGSAAASQAAAQIMPARLVGIRLNAGLAMGHAVLHRPVLTVREMVADDPEAELARLRGAVGTMQDSLDRLLAGSALVEHEESRDILETYRMFAQDRGWLARIAEAIRTGLTAEAAVQRVQNDTHARLAHLPDHYLRERLLDLDDLANRLLLHLSGRASAAFGTLPEDAVLVARSIGPAELLDYEESRLRGLVLEDGSATSHVSIVARSMNIPVVGRCAGAMSTIEPWDPIIVDADNGNVLVRPAEDVQELFARTMSLRAARRRAREAETSLPAESKDGVRVSLHMNAGLLADIPHLAATGADGVGLYRTEIPFMVRSNFPDVTEQTRIYREVLDQAGDKPVMFRTLDIGGDKLLPYLKEEPVENPALGWRAIRIGLDRPALLRQQLRALIRAAAGRTIGIMFPLVSEVAELDAARALLTKELERARHQDERLPERLKVGIMLEVPALLWQLDALLPRVDFIAVGSNDLLQYLYACDRGSAPVAQRYDPLSPAALTMLRMLVGRCAEAGVPISLCGEMAGRPLEAMALIGIGFRQLSMVPGAIAEVRAMIRSLTVSQLERYLDRLMSGADHSLREKLRGFAMDRGIEI
ncbi:MAG: phosphoenolpyruvate--protein phosphotransferase [Rhodospirillaceae bacterium]|nr:phosphoenolpyruvate--protein phosphotransferase [Rhodospirillaceae bacterium]